MVPPRLGGSAPGVLFEIWLRSTTQTARRAAQRFIRASREAAEHHHQVPSNHPPQQPFFSSLFEAITSGVFQATRSAVNHPRVSSPARLTPLRPTLLQQSLHASRGIRHSAAGRRAFGPAPRPVLSHNTAQLGLGAARNFSSAKPVFDNIITNVPLALRALGDIDGIDGRRWRQIRRAVRKSEATHVKGHGCSPISRNDAMRREFNLFFGSAIADNGSTGVFSALANDECISHETSVPAPEPVALILPLDPSISAETTPYPTTPPVAESFRLLTPAVLAFIQMIDQAYGLQAHRIRALMYRLQQAGVFEDEVTVQLDFSGGAKVAKFTFPLSWTRVDVLQACGHWRDGEAWFEIVGGELPMRQIDHTSTMKPSPTVDSFMLPEPSASFDDDDLESPPLSPTGTITPSELGSDDSLESDSEGSSETRLHAGIASTFVLPLVEHHDEELSLSDEMSDSVSNWGEG